MKILVNTISTKKHSGGAYQIAYNFLLKTIEHQEVEWVYVVSSDLDEILPTSLKNRGNYHVFPTQPDFKGSYKRVKKDLTELEANVKPDVVYSITAPSYFTFKTPEVMRFTMPWVTHPNKYSWSVLSWSEKLKMYFYCWNQRRMMRKAFYFVTQTDTTKNGIMRITGVPSENVKVVKNVLPQIFKSLNRMPKEPDGKWIDVACIGNSSAHKNFDILPDVLIELKQLGVENVRFQVTLPTNSAVWNTIQKKLVNTEFENRVVTHGRCSQIELAEVYRGCQLSFLPTLLEVFSASTLEAMYFRLPAVATDFEFNREVMGNSCLYYDPMNAKAAAGQIKKYIESESLREKMKLQMDKQLEQFSDYDKHFNDILVFLNEVSQQNGR